MGKLFAEHSRCWIDEGCQRGVAVIAFWAIPGE
jgi:hypothetical protein